MIKRIGVEDTFPPPISVPLRIFYAHMGKVEIGIDWPSDNTEIADLLRKYLDLLELAEYDKVYVIDEMRDKTKNELKREFNSLFPSVKGKHGIQIPLELKEPVKLLSSEELGLLTKIANILKGERMNDVLPMGEQVPTQASPAVTTPKKDVTGLTLDNFREKMGSRFRMTKEQKARGLTREQAFAEWLQANA